MAASSPLDQLDLSRLAKRLVSEDGLKDESFALLAITEYKKFFFLLVDSEYEATCNAYLPSPIVDLVWQRHMLDTLNYFDDCTKYNMPNGYCHRHELRTALTTSKSDSASSEAKEEVNITFSTGLTAQQNYSFTLKSYEEMYGQQAPEEVWPQKYDYGALIEKRKHCDVKYLSYAIPHADIPAPMFNHNTFRDDNANKTYALPDDLELVKELMWVGELVYDTLPVKQAQCIKGEAIGQITFGNSERRAAAVNRVTREYARFLLLIMRRGVEDAERERETRNSNHESEVEELQKRPEITPSKLVDELWHAHILCSPAYFDFW